MSSIERFSQYLGIKHHGVFSAEQFPKLSVLLSLFLALSFQASNYLILLLPDLFGKEVFLVYVCKDR